jgi:hypothetical protein
VTRCRRRHVRFLKIKPTGDPSRNDIPTEGSGPEREPQRPTGPMTASALGKEEAMPW